MDENGGLWGGESGLLYFTGLCGTYSDSKREHRLKNLNSLNPLNGVKLDSWI